jgi:membrane protease YdiL (CAAX protease family)
VKIKQHSYNGFKIGILVVILAGIQLLLFGIRQGIFLMVTRTDYSDHMASMFGMIVLIICFFILARKHHIQFSVFPQKFTPVYMVASVVFAILILLTPSNYIGGVQPIALLVYGSIVTPVFEELIFRGYVWNKLNDIFAKEWKTYIVSTILFALWHFGYISSVAFRINDGLLHAMIWKVITGLCFGIVLGLLRLKTKNCYSTMLLHGILNIFGR